MGMRRDRSKRETLADIHSHEALWELRCGSTRCMRTAGGAAPSSDASADPAPTRVGLTTAAVSEMC
jgi:hypothetical protein